MPTVYSTRTCQRCGMTGSGGGSSVYCVPCLKILDRVIKRLAESGELNNAEIGEVVGLSGGAVHKRRVRHGLG